jgi:hypothetical protein
VNKQTEVIHEAVKEVEIHKNDVKKLDMHVCIYAKSKQLIMKTCNITLSESF